MKLVTDAEIGKILRGEQPAQIGHWRLLYDRLAHADALIRQAAKSAHPGTVKAGLERYLEEIRA